MYNVHGKFIFYNKMYTVHGKFIFYNKVIKNGFVTKVKWGEEPGLVLHVESHTFTNYI